MSAVKQAILNLSQAVSRLESAIDYASQPEAGHQRDMFSGILSASKKAGNGKINPEIVAQKLDRAIGHIENMLSEGNA